MAKVIIDPYKDVGKTIHDILTPALVIDTDNLATNIRLMAEYAADKGFKLRSHTKTHNSSCIAQKQVEASGYGITVATLEQACAMHNAGVTKDILIANEIYGKSAIEYLAELARECAVKIAVDNLNNAKDISKVMREQGITLDVLIEMDVGLGRAGLRLNEALELYNHLTGLQGINVIGVQAYEGQIDEKDKNKRAELVEESFTPVKNFLSMITSRDKMIVSHTGTRTAYEAPEFSPDIKNRFGDFVQELQCGTYVVGDGNYTSKYLPSGYRIALKVLSKVLSKHDDTIVIDAGLQAIGTDHGLPVVLGSPLEYKTPHEEHGICKGQGVRPGNLLWLVPMHACTTMPKYSFAYGAKGEQITDVIPIDARR